MIRNTKQAIIIYVAVIFFLIMSLLYFSMSRDIFPGYFFNDNWVIRNYMQNTSFGFDRNFYNTAKFFTFFGFKGDSSYGLESFFSWGIFSLLMIVLFTKYRINFLDGKNLLLAFLFTIFFGAYSAQFSKELVVFILLTFVMILSSKKNLRINFMFFVLLYGIFFRTYWLLILAMSISLYFILNFKKNSKLKQILCIVIVIIVMQFLYNKITGKYLTDNRYSVNLWRSMDINSNTIINNPMINSGLISDFVNFLYGFCDLIIPIDGIGSKNEIIYYFWIWIIIALCIKKIYKEKSYKNYNFSFLVAMLIIQAFFEPDIGSALRHQIVLVPILLLFINGVSSNKKGIEVVN